MGVLTKNFLPMLNYKILLKHNPFVYTEFTNSLSQKVQLVEHPTKGDSVPVIALFPDYELAFYTDFFETGDIDEVGGDYEVLLLPLPTGDPHIGYGYELPKVD